MDLDILQQGPAIIASAIISAFIALSVVFINRYFESLKVKKQKYDTVKKYAKPLILACEQFAWRLKEILELKAGYLLPNAPMNDFFKYKFESTAYRLCAVLGWIEAAKKEQSYIEGTNTRHHKDIQYVISNFQAKLADGGHVELSILEDLSKLFNLSLDSLDSNNRNLCGVELEKLIFSYIPESNKALVKELDEKLQIEMLSKIMDFICDKIHKTRIDEDVVAEKRSSAIHEISRNFCWIYRDWQSAIGDQMINPIEGANRRFDVISFGYFYKARANFYIRKVDNLFAGLNVDIDDRFDSRVKQLKQIFDATVKLIETFKGIVKKQESIPNESLSKLQIFNEKINGNTAKREKKKLKILISYS